MVAVNEGPDFNQPWGPGASGSTWGNPRGAGHTRPNPAWNPLAGIGRPAAIALTVLGFILWWPVGFAALFYMIGSGRFGRGRHRGWQSTGQAAWMQGAPASWNAWKGWACGNGAPASSGNHAFDEYRNETLKRLEDEQQEFGAFLERLRFAKDKAEFDQFMAERRARPPAPPAGPEQTPG